MTRTAASLAGAAVLRPARALRRRTSPRSGAPNGQPGLPR